MIQTNSIHKSSHNPSTIKRSWTIIPSITKSAPHKRKSSYKTTMQSNHRHISKYHRNYISTIKITMHYHISKYRYNHVSTIKRMLKMHVTSPSFDIIKMLYYFVPLLDNKNIQNAYYPKYKQRELNKVRETAPSINNQENK